MHTDFMFQAAALTLLHGPLLLATVVRSLPCKAVACSASRWHSASERCDHVSLVSSITRDTLLVLPMVSSVLIHCVHKGSCPC